MWVKQPQNLRIFDPDFGSKPRNDNCLSPKEDIYESPKHLAGACLVLFMSTTSCKLVGILCRKQRSARRDNLHQNILYNDKGAGYNMSTIFSDLPSKALPLLRPPHICRQNFLFWFLMLSIPCGYLHPQYGLNLILLQCNIFCWYFSDRACDLNGAVTCFQQAASTLASFGLFFDIIINI